MTRNPKRPSGRTRISSADGAPPVSRPASATITTLNSSPFAAWIVSRRTASAPSSSETASSCDAPTASWSRMNVDEPLDVRAAQLLVGAREPHQLAQVRVAPLAVPAGEHREVVVVSGDDLLAEPLEARARRRGDEPLVPLLERAHEALVVVGQSLGQRALDAGEERALAGVTADRARARRSRRRRTATPARSRAPRRRSGCAAAAGTRAGRRPAAGRSSLGRSRGRSAALRPGAPTRSARRRCRRRRAARSRRRWPHRCRRARARAARSPRPRLRASSSRIPCSCACR